MQEIKALFFDQDGTIIDTERDGHRVAFNKAFKEFGFDVEWDIETYYSLLEVAGGKERMRHYLNTKGFGTKIADENVDQLIIDLHKKKTEIFVELIQSGALPLRPGIHRIMKEANDRGISVSICTTAALKSANAVVATLLSDIKFDHILAGDIIKNKKPAPDIYQLAMEKTGFNADQCVAIEDSSVGLRSGLAAGLPVVVTKSTYTVEEDFTGANIVVNCLGDDLGEKAVIHVGKVSDNFAGMITLEDILASTK
ncbi:MAG: HAD-IA family hydrolase [Desulfotalea sp.]